MASIYPDHNQTAWISARRPSRSVANPLLPYGFFLEQERSASGQIATSACILLTNKECPWRCLMCDLWKHTVTEPVPLGAIPKQIDYALAQLGRRPDQVKLYNSGSFFDPAAIPPEDYSAIADCVAFARHVIVEAHPRLIGARALGFRDLLAGTLEVAMGLETVHPDVLPRLNKRFTLDQFARAVSFLRKAEIGVRAFVLVKPPFLDASQAVEWAVKSAKFAFECGVDVVSLIPTRLGNGALEALMTADEFAPPSLAVLERALESTLELRGGRVFADTWNLSAFSTCQACLPLREKRLYEMNLTQSFIPPIICKACSDGSRTFGSAATRKPTPALSLPGVSDEF